MSCIEGGGPAYPCPSNGLDRDGDEALHAFPGVTIRDWFAGMALNGLCANSSEEMCKVKADVTVKWAYELADEMMKARKPEL